MKPDHSDLYITRKRKKWKFAHFALWPHCFEGHQITSAKWADYFGSQQPVVVEIGAGTADLSVGLSQRHPQTHFVAVDVKADRLYTGAKFVLEHELKNLAFVRAHASQLTAVFAPKSVQQLWLTFPDPFARTKQAKHRLTHPNFLQKYRDLLAPDGKLRLKTDNLPLFLWSLEQLVQQGWHIQELSFDLHQSGLPEDYKITTYYERKFTAEDKKINYLSASQTLRPNHPLPIT